MTTNPSDPDPGDTAGHNRWAVKLTASAIRDLDALSARVAPAIVEFLYGPLADNPYRLGKPLRDDFAGSYGARRGSYRVLYDIEDDNHALRLHRITARATAYRRR
jgi:mRNA-degrading endonuclease RelE of RelBE toxin-antitoxin system